LSCSISVIIVTWDALKHLKTFLPSVTNTQYEDFEIIIADNASTDDSAGWVRTNHPGCRIVTFPRNYGYCGGNNRAVDHANGEILLFLNNDVEVQPDWLQHIGKVFEDPAVAAAQPKILSYREQGKFEYAGAAGGFLDKMGFPFCRGRVFDTIEPDTGQYDDPVPLFWASGAAFAIRKDVFLELERFDEDFRFHMEEIDLCWRLLNRGYTIGFAPESRVYHLGGGSLPMDSSRKTFFNFRNSLYMLWKNASEEWLKKYFFLRLCLDGLAFFYALLKGNPGDSKAIFKAHLHFYSTWRSVHMKRKELQKKRKIDGEPEQMVDTWIIRDYFLLRKKTYPEIIKSVTKSG
jgi:GT2 family glycosyltransferase